MSLNPHREARVGDYVISVGDDTEPTMEEMRRILMANGCKQFRVEELQDGRFNVHGYLAAAQ